MLIEKQTLLIASALLLYYRQCGNYISNVMFIEKKRLICIVCDDDVIHFT